MHYRALADKLVAELRSVDKPERDKNNFLWFGAKSMYDKAGFTEVARRNPQRPVVRIRPE